MAGPVYNGYPLWTKWALSSRTRWFGAAALFVVFLIWSILTLQNQIAQAADEQILLVSSLKNNTVLIYDGATGAHSGFLEAPAASQPVNPTGLAVGPDGNYYVASSGTHQVLRFKADSWQYDALFVTAGSGGLVAPKGIVFDKQGLLYVSSASDQILRYNADGTFKDVFVDGPGKDGGGLDDPYGLAFGPDEHLYVVDRANSGVLRYDGSTGFYIDMFTSGAPLNGPTDIKFGPTGNIFVTDTGGAVLHIFNGNNGQILDSIGTAALNEPTGLAFREKTLFVANRGLHNVLRYDGSAMTWPGFVAAGVGGLDSPMYMLFTENKTLPLPTPTPTVTPTATPVPGTACAPVQMSDLPTTWEVNTTVDDATTALTLRCALIHANRGDTIRFAPAIFPQNVPATISLAAALPAITQGSITVDGAGAGVILDGSNLPAGTSGLVIQSDNNRIVHLQILNMPRHGIEVDGNGNVIGSSLPAVAVANRAIGGPPETPANLISGNGRAGIWIKGHRNQIMGNYIGTTVNGMVAQPNDKGILVTQGTANRIGAGANGYGNLLSGNREPGVEIQGEFVQENRVEGNYIGTNLAGSGALANGTDGVLLHSAAHQNHIGSTAMGGGNLISGNGGTALRAEGVLSLTVEANYIGIDIGGAAALANGQYGMLLRNSGHATIGTRRTETGNRCDGGCNLVAGNQSHGIVITGGASAENAVRSNFIGTDVTGTKAVANGGSGLWLDGGAHDNTIGSKNTFGSSVTYGNNLISGNGGNGVVLSGEGTTANEFFGNIIGMDLAQLQALGNDTGMLIEQNTQRNVVGGQVTGEANVIAGNREHGLHLRGSDTALNQIVHNHIGTTATGAEYTGRNGGNGLLLEAGAHDNIIGRDGGSYAGNIIGYNGNHGIELSSVASNHIVGNLIGRNGDGTNFGNFGSGLLLHNSASANTIHGNLIGNNRVGGLRIEGGALNNVVGREGFQPSDYNLIIVNIGHGVEMRGQGTTGNQLINNRIGTDTDATDGLGNTLAGVYLRGEANNNTLAKNVVVDSATHGLILDGVDGNLIRENWIGLAPNQAGVPIEIGNAQSGIYLLNGADNNRISSNRIGANRTQGIHLQDAVGRTVGNTISLNSIYSNNGSGIYLNGGNRNLAAPAITNIEDDGAGHWTVIGTTCASCALELFYDQADEGRRYVDSIAAGADGRFQTAIVAPPDGWNLTMTATDGEGNTSQFSEPFLAPFAWLVADHVEVVQTIQTIANDLEAVPLIAEKRTVVRFHVHSEGGGVPNVDATLNAVRNGIALQPINLLPLAPITVLPNPDRGEVDQSFTFLIPNEWASGEVELVATVNGDGAVRESVLNDNTTRKVVSFRREGPLCVRVVQVRTEPQTASRNGPEFLSVLQRTEEILPVPYVRVLRGGTVSENGGGWELPDDKEDLLNELWWRNFFTDEPDSCDDHAYYFGIAHPDHARAPGDPQRFGGSGFISGDEAWGFLNTEPRGGAAWTAPAGGSTMAHELGHNFGREHIRCGGPDKPWDPFPYLNPDGDPCVLGPNREDGYYGFSISANAVITPTEAGDIMGYRHPRWISDYNYRNFLRQMENTVVQRTAGNTAFTLADETELIIASGILSATQGSATFDRIYRTTAATIDRNKAARTMQQQALQRMDAETYTLQLRAADDTVLMAQAFQPAHTSDHEGDGERFHVVMAAHPEMRELVLLQDGTELVQRAVSQHAPTVQVTSPNGGETVSGELAVAWQATDKDGDALTYNVQYSPDNGQSWTMVAMGIEATNVTIAADMLTGSASQAFIRVTAVDGVNTGTDQSDKAFTVAGQAPQVLIQTIAEQSAYAQGASVVLQGRAFDGEDETLAETAYSWSSNLDGKLNVGSELFITTLSPGTHTITLIVTDSDGQQGQATTEIVVEKTEEPLSGPQQRIFLPTIVNR